MKQRKKFIVKRYSEEEWMKFREQYTQQEWDKIQSQYGFKGAVSRKDLPRAAEIAEECVRGNVSIVRLSKLLHEYE